MTRDQKEILCASLIALALILYTFFAAGPLSRWLWNNVTLMRRLMGGGW